MSIFEIFSKDYLRIKSSKVFEKGILLFKDKNYSEALNKFSESLKLIEKLDIDQTQKNDLIASVLFVMSQARGKMAQFELAEQDLKRAITLHPNDESIYWNLGSLKLDQKQFEQAIPFFEKMIFIDPLNFDGYYWKGISLLELERYEEAAPCFEKVLESEPENEEVYFNLGFIYEELKKYEKAVKFYDGAIALNSEYNEAFVNRGNCKIELGQRAEACIDFNRALELGDTGVHENIDKYCK